MLTIEKPSKLVSGLSAGSLAFAIGIMGAAGYVTSQLDVASVFFSPERVAQTATSTSVGTVTVEDSPADEASVSVDAAGDTAWPSQSRMVVAATMPAMRSAASTVAVAGTSATVAVVPSSSTVAAVGDTPGRGGATGSTQQPPVSDPTGTLPPATDPTPPTGGETGGGTPLPGGGGIGTGGEPTGSTPGGSGGTGETGSGETPVIPPVVITPPPVDTPPVVQELRVCTDLELLGLGQITIGEDCRRP